MNMNELHVKDSLIMWTRGWV